MSLLDRLRSRFDYVLVRRSDRHDTLEQHLVSVFDHWKVNCVLDVGANAGQYAKSLRALGYRGRIVSVEPLPDVYETLREAAKSDPSWRTYNFALGDRKRTESLRVHKGSTLSSFHALNELGRRRFSKSSPDAGIVTVPIETLEERFAEFVEGIDEPRVFLKMDTQGYDLNVIAGGNRCLDRIVALQSEIATKPIYDGMPSYVTALGTYDSLGYEVTGFFVVNRDNRSPAVIEFDCVMQRRTA